MLWLQTRDVNTQDVQNSLISVPLEKIHFIAWAVCLQMVLKNKKTIVYNSIKFKRSLPISLSLS